MKKKLLMAALLLSLPGAAMAQPRDAVGGADSTTQTIHHCGFLPTSSGRYTDSPVTVRIIEQKLVALGYGPTTNTGRYSKGDRLAVIAFQRDHGLQADGIVGPITARTLAFVSHPSANVRRCSRKISGIR
ncbi:MAG: peptidoglycan-binding domain-containing protein [Pseudomonadota bacterium]